MVDVTIRQVVERLPLSTQHIEADGLRRACELFYIARGAWPAVLFRCQMLNRYYYPDPPWLLASSD